jgi:hypothetical protein
MGRSSHFMYGKVLNITEKPAKISETMNIGHNFVLPEVAFEDDQYADIARCIGNDWHNKFCREVAYIRKVLQQEIEENCMQSEFLSNHWKSIKKYQTVALMFVLSTL